VTPLELVEEYARLTVRCLDRLMVQYSGTERPTVWTGLWLQPCDGGDPVRSGTLEGFGSFRLHGVGCSFELDTGEDLDVDWRSEDGVAVFNPWWILFFAQSIGDGDVSVDELRAAACSSPLIVQLSENEFTWPTRKYDAVKSR
jgi:hypothetical protein